ncbi:hypothetical protein [Rubinisphaera italica]|uniref:Uncharacterized protein n=1 Tax=Rubinisphaera italica TaxID=2527969 RepID=A0A5C5XJ39_9PLAN|nr:hypothetical protein [Rubinisphaera italica]TWT63187.1 hypothetical protein Pan54_39400 [Rubinisphaera italica]
MPDYSTEIAQIEEILNSGVTEHSNDGQVTKFDHDKLRTRLRELKRLQAGSNGRARVSTIRLN